MAGIETRIKAVRKCQKLTQTEFGQRLGVKGNTITGYETGIRTPSEAVILSICREFHISELWLRTGQGEIYTSRSESGNISAFIGDVLSGEPDFRYELLTVLSGLTREEWAILEGITDMIVKKRKDARR